MSYHLTASEPTNQLLYINISSLERKIFQKDLKSTARPLRCDFVTSVLLVKRHLCQKDVYTMALKLKK